MTVDARDKLMSCVEKVVHTSTERSKPKGANVVADRSGTIVQRRQENNNSGSVCTREGQDSNMDEIQAKSEPQASEPPLVTVSSSSESGKLHIFVHGSPPSKHPSHLRKRKRHCRY